MHYFIFPSKDATIYEDSIHQNTGMDQIIELEKQLIHIQGDAPYNSRILIQFDLDEFSASLVSGETSGSDMKYYLNLTTDVAVEIPVTYSVFVYPVSQSWQMGNGKRHDIPVTTTGVSWTLRDGITVSGLTGSVWTNSGGDYFSGSNKEYEASQSFNYQTTDLHVDVTNIVESWLSGSIQNFGFMIKRDGSAEQNIMNQGNLQFFSQETHTIYRPRLEVVWKDYIYSPYTTSSISESISGSTTVDNRTTNPILYYTTSSFYTGSGIGESSGYFTQSGDDNTWYSESYSWVTESIYSYTGSVGLYHSSSISYTYTTASIDTYTSASNTWESSSFDQNATVNDFYTASLGSEYESASVHFSSASLTSSDAEWTYDTLTGVYSSQSYDAINANYLWASSSVSTSASYSTATTQMMNAISTEDFVIYLDNLQDEYVQNSRIKFRVKARELYPRKTFVTESWAYSRDTGFISSSYYEIRDAWTEEEIMPWSVYTQISVDATGSYFDLHLNGMEPERLYRILFKVVKGNIETVYDKNYAFRIIR
jgi:hypothetical protein